MLVVRGAVMLAGVSALGIGRAAVAGSVQTPPLYLGLDSYLHLGQLSYLEVGDRVGGQSAADPGGSDKVVRERLLLHRLGPGIVMSMRMREDLGSPWQVTADGSSLTFGPADLGLATAAYWPTR